MTDRVVIDFVTPPAWPAELMRLGVSGAAVYVGPASWPKVVTRAWIDAGLAVDGFGFAFIWEAGIRDYQGGVGAGAAGGNTWAAGMNRLGLPVDAGATITYDTSIPPAEFAVAADYARGFAQAIGPRKIVQAYAEGALIEYLVQQGIVRMGWESESKSFPGNQTPTAHTTMVQIYGRTVAGLGGSYDYNAVLADDWGQWPAHTPTPPVTVSEEPLIPRRVTSTIAGREAWAILANPAGVVNCFGFDVKDTPGWSINRALKGVVVATLDVAHQGVLHGPYDAKDGTTLVLCADGDGGTFELPYAHIDAAPGPSPAPAPGPDIAALSAAVATRLKLTTIE